MLLFGSHFHCTDPPENCVGQQKDLDLIPGSQPERRVNITCACNALPLADYTLSRTAMYPYTYDQNERSAKVLTRDLVINTGLIGKYTCLAMNNASTQNTTISTFAISVRGKYNSLMGDACCSFKWQVQMSGGAELPKHSVQASKNYGNVTVCNHKIWYHREFEQFYSRKSRITCTFHWKGYSQIPCDIIIDILTVFWLQLPQVWLSSKLTIMLMKELLHNFLAMWQ